MLRMITSKNFTTKYIDNLFKKADRFKVNNYVPSGKNKMLVNAFFENQVQEPPCLLNLPCIDWEAM